MGSAFPGFGMGLEFQGSGWDQNSKVLAVIGTPGILVGLEFPEFRWDQNSWYLGLISIPRI